MMLGYNAFDEPCHARNTDPDTSKDNASKVLAQAASRWVLVALELDRDRPIVDERIFDICNRLGCRLSGDRLRHGRKALEEIGWVEHAGFGTTARGKMARAWRLKRWEPDQYRKPSPRLTQQDLPLCKLGNGEYAKEIHG